MTLEMPTVAIVTPCFNEGAGILDFLKKVETALKRTNEQFIIITVDDCSQDNTLEQLRNFQFHSPLHQLHILSLHFNVGHQGAIYQGLLYASTLNVAKVIIMDSDGEDDPDAIPELLQQKDFSIVEVKRGKRAESLLFQICYTLYKFIFHLITGKSMDYGNYCMIDRDMVNRISYTSFIHLPAYLLKQKATKTSIQNNRQKRISGKSKMGMQGLLIHAFKSLIEFGEDLLMMFLKLFLAISVLLLLLLGNIFYQKFIAKTAILGWFSTLTIGLLNLGMICFGFFIIGILILNLIHQQNNRTQKNIYSIIKNTHEPKTLPS